MAAAKSAITWVFQDWCVKYLCMYMQGGVNYTRGFAPGSLKETVGTSYRHVISYLVSYPSIYVVVICSTIHQHVLLPYVASFTNISIFYMQHNLLICLAVTYSTTYQCTYLPYAA